MNHIIKNKFAASNIVGRPGNGTRCRDLENQSMTTMITMFLLDWGSVMKSMVMWDQGCCGVVGGTSLLAGRDQGILD